MPNKKWTILVALAAAWLGYAPAATAQELSAEEEALVLRTFRCNTRDGSLTSDACFVRNSPGGDINDFIAAAKTLYFKGKRLVCDGLCYSANVIAFDRTLYKARSVAKERGVSMDNAAVCITERAKFLLHEHSDKTQRVFFINPDLQAWVNANGPLLNKNLPDDIRRKGPSSKEWQAWVEKYGALPRTQKMSESLALNFEQASAFWPKCGPTQVVTR
jgi:hypothetical protein